MPIGVLSSYVLFLIKKGTFQYFSVLKNLHGIAFLYNFAAEKR